MTQTVFIYRGLPASGKSTDAQARMNAMNGQAVRIERDMLRDQLYNNRYYARPAHWTHMTDEDFKVYLSERENTITSVQFSMAQAAIAAGKSVIISDTNLPAKVVKKWIEFANTNNVAYEIISMDNISVDECIKRDKHRDNAVGEEVIRKMHKDHFVKGKLRPVQITDKPKFIVEPYDNPKGLPLAVVVDIDGTLAKMAGRSPYEWHRVGEDTPVEAVIDAVHAAAQFNRRIIVMSGRDESCRAITEEWLTKHLGVSWHELHMRPEGDSRKDNIIKYELFNKHIRSKYHVKYILDDRDQVVRMWRELGLNCFQVAPGAF